MSKVHECKIEHLRPTQITVGMIEVEDKFEHISKIEPSGDSRTSCAAARFRRCSVLEGKALS